MTEKAFISCVLILLACHAFAQADCPSARISLSMSDALSLEYDRLCTLKVLVNNAGDAEANINKVFATVGYTFLSCDSYKLLPNQRTECRITVSPVPGKALLVQVDYNYVSCGRTRVAQSQISVFESKELTPSESAQTYAIDVHGGCENSYYACSSSADSGKYSVGYKCYSKDANYYSPAKERLNLKFDLPIVPSIVLYGAKLKIAVTAVNKAQELSLYKISSSWQPVSCEAGGDICTQPYCGECKALFDASGSIISSNKIYSTGDVSFDVTDAVAKAYSLGQKTLSLQLRGTEDLWESSGSASCGIWNAWQTQDVDMRGDDYGEPHLVLTYLGKDVKSRGSSFGGEICIDCCKNADTDCNVECGGGDRTMSGDPITSCSYVGQTLLITWGTNFQQYECLNGQCKSGATTTTQNTTTTSAVTNTLVNSTTTSGAVTTSSSSPTTTLGTGNCIDGTPVGQCSTWMDDLRCVDSPWGPSFKYDTSCSSNPNSTTSTPSTSMPSPIDSCFGTPVGSCSTMMDCTRCVSDPTTGMSYIDYDDTCCSGSSTIPNPTTPPTTIPNPGPDSCFGTPVGDCSTFMDCLRCVDDPTIGMPYLDYDDTCCSGSSTTLTSTTTLTTTSFVTTTFTSTSFVTTSFVTTTYSSTTFGTTTSSAATSSTPTTTTQATTTSSVTTTTLSSCVPAYDPNKWNNNRRALNCNNCYNYGCDKETDNFAQPGYAHGYRVSMDCSSVISGAKADGLNYLGKTDGACTGCTHKVALVVSPGNDFHWYRLDNNGRWSHKPGSTAVRDVDESGNKITNPETADRGIYTSFCGYFCVDKNAVSITGGSSCPY